MKHFALILALASATFPAKTFAERNLVPSLDPQPDVCVERPAEPNWMQDIDLREAYQRILLQDIYRARNLEQIIATGTCACATRFPAREAAETEFFERFATAERWEMLEASENYNRRANSARPDAMAICEAEGNW